MAKKKGGLGNIMKQAQRMQAEMERIQAEMEKKTVEAQAGGGVVKAVATGGQEVVSITINPEVVDPDDVDMLEDLVLAAVNEALRQAREMVTSEMQKLAGGMQIPGLF
jgi:DNA-binding YbaB/EbfC family protein